MTLDYAPTRADRADVPAAYVDEPRYPGYRSADADAPWAPFYREHTADPPADVLETLRSGMAAPDGAVLLRDLAAAMSAPGRMALETGWTRRDGLTHVAVRTAMPGVSAAMWDWWFGWHGTHSSRYKLWHPDAHRRAVIGEDRSHDRTLTDRQRYVDNVSYVDELIGPRLHRLAIRFVAPSRLGFEDRPGETQVCARVGFSDRPLLFGWLVHQVRPTSDGCEMRSRFVLGDVGLVDLPRGSQGRALGAGVLAAARSCGLRRVPPGISGPMLPRGIGPDLLRHCSEEMTHLAGLLPRLHEAFRDMP